jgi:hypothetical protein
MIPFAGWAATGGKLINKGVKTADAFNYSTIYRSVSNAEVEDLLEFGIRNKPGAYETEKLFAPTLEEATKFGRINFAFNGIPNTLIEVQIPNHVLQGSLRFEADLMNAIAVPANQLHLLKATPLNFSPISP